LVILCTGVEGRRFTFVLSAMVKAGSSDAMSSVPEVMVVVLPASLALTACPSWRTWWNKEDWSVLTALTCWSGYAPGGGQVAAITVVAGQYFPVKNAGKRR
jgi:hypothetical protein